MAKTRLHAANVTILPDGVLTMPITQQHQFLQIGMAMW